MFLPVTIPDGLVRTGSDIIYPSASGPKARLPWSSARKLDTTHHFDRKYLSCQSAKQKLVPSNGSMCSRDSSADSATVLPQKPKKCKWITYTVPSLKPAFEPYISYNSSILLPPHYILLLTTPTVHLSPAALETRPPHSCQAPFLPQARTRPMH